jgi:hypothetical protein
METELREQLDKYQADHKDQFDNLTDVIRRAILEKIDPEIRRKMIKAELVALRAEGDPDICALLPPNPPR